MAHDVLIAGALFPDVPSVQFPDSQQQWHSFTDVSDTTAAAADVASGKQFYDASGTLTQGTASGGGGPSNILTGTFTPSGSAGAKALTVPYAGSGYPIAVAVWADGGLYNPNTSWYTRVQRDAIGFWAMVKNDASTAPTYPYSESTAENQGYVVSVRKDSTSSATSYTASSSSSAFVYTSSSASSSYWLCVKLDNVPASFGGGLYIRYYQTPNSNKIGLATNITYRYVIVLSE